MVVQARREALRLIRQLDHSLVSGRMALEWIGTSGDGPSPFDVALGIALHDLSWGREDREPVLDPATGTPLSFLTIPDDRRVALYAEGLDRVEEIDASAAMLGSLHYARFVARHDYPEFLAREEARRARLQDRIPAREAEEWQQAADLLRHLDDLSLFVCLTAPGCEECPDWLEADRVSGAPDGTRHELTWIADDTLAFRPFPFRREIVLAIPYRGVPRRRYASEADLLDAWRGAAPAFQRVRLVAGE